MLFPEKGGRRRCPVERCPGVLATQAAMRVHFVNRHVHDTVVMLEEGNLPLPWCPRCGLQVSKKAVNGRPFSGNNTRCTSRSEERLV